MPGVSAWCSLIGGLFPMTALAITRAPKKTYPGSLAPYRKFEPTMGTVQPTRQRPTGDSYGSRAGGIGRQPCLPLPLKALEETDRQELAKLLHEWQLA